MTCKDRSNPLNLCTVLSKSSQAPVRCFRRDVAVALGKNKGKPRKQCNFNISRIPARENSQILLRLKRILVPKPFHSF